ncbi:MAG: DinB family protein [Schleiferiaceae bacterium]|nr:DinB family protein [Schleiferiaceae bacterium]MDG1918128.1 DinB family protein [Schleiferiaceae bacterium]
MQAPEYITNRLNELAQHKAQFEQVFYFLEDDELFFIPEGELWSAIECIEHINNVNEVYLPQLTKVCQLTDAKESSALEMGWLTKKARVWMQPITKAKALKIPAPKKLKPRRLRNPNLKIAPQKVMENFISDLSQIEKLVRIIPNSKDLCDSRVTSALPPFKIKSITALEIIIPHIARHLAQAERILKGGKLAKDNAPTNPDLIYPTREAEKK